MIASTGCDWLVQPDRHFVPAPPKWHFLTWKCKTFRIDSYNTHTCALPVDGEPCIFPLSPFLYPLSPFLYPLHPLHYSLPPFSTNSPPFLYPLFPFLYPLLPLLCQLLPFLRQPLLSTYPDWCRWSSSSSAKSHFQAPAARSCLPAWVPHYQWRCHGEYTHRYFAPESPNVSHFLGTTWTHVRTCTVCAVHNTVSRLFPLPYLSILFWSVTGYFLSLARQLFTLALAL